MSTDDDPFERLGVPRRFMLSETEIRERRRRALERIHPDRAADPVARALALRESAAISAAARCLLDARSRAETLLRAAKVDPAPAPPAELLMEMLEWRERVEEARRSGDAGELSRERETISARVEEIRAALAEAIDGTHARAGSVADSERAEAVADPARAGALLTELRLVERLLEQAGDA